MNKITKVVIPAAGFGTRFLPATKAQPKEMLPIIDKPTIQYIVEEAVFSGIKTIILVTSQNKRSVEDHFDRNYELEDHLEKTGKTELLVKLRQISEIAEFIYIRQKGAYGNGTPILNAEPAIQNEPFAVVWGDDLVESEKPRLKQLIEVYQQYQNPVLTAYPVDDEGTKKYGIIDGEEVEPGIFKVKGIVEKPGPEKAPSRLAAIGGYILTPDIFDSLRETPPGKNNELWLVDGIFNLSKKRPIYACLIKGKYHDVGSKIGWLKANIEYGLKNPEVSLELRRYLKEIAENL
ncbi:UTP--glucose-1-phosphate uridylyltransferase [Candidatus Aerophobetes bacterium]|uniref:UTP--glucose-1-phosphate uridylyltransferase n=1 Tax=Aerophobetes bacterium TaxID=2030807 RepID=A0A662DAY8_UNCAE|nr:MAG: UTP--glucose-1-phosphate uridylyltransferase [Candidatus Aerophobetes bacterium]